MHHFEDAFRSEKPKFIVPTATTNFTSTFPYSIRNLKTFFRYLVSRLIRKVHDTSTLLPSRAHARYNATVEAKRFSRIATTLTFLRIQRWTRLNLQKYVATFVRFSLSAKTAYVPFSVVLTSTLFLGVQPSARGHPRKIEFYPRTNVEMFYETHPCSKASNVSFDFERT